VPFENNSDRAHAVAALLLSFIRRMITGPTPLHLVEAPTPGSGKSLLSEAISVIATGHNGHLMSFSTDEDETRKKITSALSMGSGIIIMDNIKRGLDSAVLSGVLTSTLWTDRWLGTQKLVRLRNRSLWMATANNPKLSTEMARRIIRIRLDPGMDRPWQRTNFRHAPLIKWVKANRAELVAAVLTLIQAWLSSGKSPGQHSLGSFESWAEITGGILQSAGIPGFLESQEELYEMADSDGAQWREFVNAWWDRFGTQSLKVSELNYFCEDNDLMNDLRGDGTPRSQQSRLGRALLSFRGRTFGLLKIETSIARNYRIYSLVPIEKNPSGDNSAHSSDSSIKNKANDLPEDATDFPFGANVELLASKNTKSAPKFDTKNSRDIKEMSNMSNMSDFILTPGCHAQPRTRTWPHAREEEVAKKFDMFDKSDNISNNNELQVRTSCRTSEEKSAAKENGELGSTEIFVNHTGEVHPGEARREKWLNRDGEIDLAKVEQFPDGGGGSQ